jgi:hypothetical protein
MHDDNCPSKEQQAWQEAATKLREKLVGMIDFAEAMKPEELVSLANALQTAYWVDVNAESFDQQVAKAGRQFDSN